MKRIWKKRQEIGIKSLVGLMLALLLAGVAVADEGSTHKLDDVVVTATRTERIKEELPAAVTVIDKEELRQTPAMSPLELLDQAAGVISYNTKGFLSSSTANKTIVRGLGGISSGHVLVLVDGVPSNDTQSSIFHWNDLNPADIERIEIVRGPGSALYGSSAMGGVINIITAKPKEGFNGWVEGGYGTYNTWQSGAGVNGKTGRLGYYLSGRYRQSDGYVARPHDVRMDHNSKEEAIEAENARVKLSYDLTDTATIVVTASHSDFERTGQEKYIEDYVLFQKKIQRYGVQYHQKLGWGELKVNLFGDVKNGRYDSADSSTGYTTRKYIAYSDETNYGASVQVGFGLGEHQYITVGGDYKAGEQDQDKQYPADPGFTNINGGKEQLFALFAQDEINLLNEKLILNIGGRMDWWERFDGYSHDDGLSPNPGRVEYDSQSDSDFNPKFGFRYNITKSVGIRGTVGTAYKIPQMSNMYREFRYWSSIYQPNPNLGPEKSLSYDLGFDIQQGNFSFSLTGFRTDADDFIHYVEQGTDGSNTIYKYQNIGKVKIYGYEAEAKYRFHPDWQVFWNHVVNEPRIEEYDPDPTLEDKYLKNTPLEKTSIGIVFSNPDILTASLSARHVGTIYTKDDNSEHFGNYWTVNAKIGRKFRFNGYVLEASLEGQNLFNAEERENRYYRGPGSTYMCNLKFEW